MRPTHTLLVLVSVEADDLDEARRYFDGVVEVGDADGRIGLRLYLETVTQITREEK